jgi:hypothetical protein
MSASSVLSVYKDSPLKSLTNRLKEELEESQAFVLLIEQKLNVASGLTIQEVKPLSLGLNHYVSYYEDKSWRDGELKNSFGYYFTKNTPETTVEIATNHLKSVYSQLEKMHQANLLAIENNKKVWESVTNFMVSLGVRTTYSIYEAKSSRSTKKVEVQKMAGWLNDLHRLVKTDDGWKQVEADFKIKQEAISKYLKDKVAEVEAKNRVKEAEQKDKLRLEVFATLRVKYSLEPEADYDDILSCLLSKDQYLNLAHAMEKTRGDWTDGFYRVESALADFNTDSKENENIYNSISDLVNGDESDGRIFRDCEYNYGELYNKVDPSLLSDFNKLQEYAPL